jgi:hypothetical protein
MEANRIIRGDCLEEMRAMPDQCVDLVFCSPPYEAARTYGIDFKLRGQDWVDWCVERYVECVRVSRGLVAWVIEGQTRKFRYSAVPALLMADLHRRGINLRKPPIFKRVGIPGSGGPDWLRNDWEWIVCATQPGKLVWSNNTAMGHPPKWAPGGAMSNRLSDGSRRNQWGGSSDGVTESQTHTRKANGERTARGRPSHVAQTVGAFGNKPSEACGREGYKKTYFNGNGHPSNRTPSEAARTAGEDGSESYAPPVLANPGNVIECIVGGGVMGHKLCHENEAPFPEDLAEFFIRSFCPPLGIVLDPFSGSGTTASVAIRTGRRYIAIDIRDSQVELTKQRLAVTQKELIA